MDGFKQLYWHQGLFLQPQHFQLRDRVAKQRLWMIQSYGHKHFWGVGTLGINEQALANNAFELRSGEFFFDDGTFVSIPDTAQSLARSFADMWPESDKPLDVYLALHRYNPFGRNVTEIAGPDEARFAPTRYLTGKDPEEVPDLHADGPPAQVKRLEHALKLFFGPERERMDDYHVIRIARLVREGDDIVLSRRYIPPCLSLEATPVLSGLVQEIRDLTAARCRVLEQYKSHNSLRRSEKDLQYIVYLLALMALNRHLPVLNHLRTANMVHPWEIYGALCQFIGELSTFSLTLNASGESRTGETVLPPYDHQDLWNCFLAAQTVLGGLLEGIVLGPEYLIPLLRKEEYFVAAPPEGVFARDHAFWLILRTEKDLGPQRKAIGRSLKLSARTSIATLVALAVPGVGLEYSEDPPSGMPQDPTAIHFKIDHNCPQWLEIAKTRTISLYYAEAPDDLTAELAVIRQ